MADKQAQKVKYFEWLVKVEDNQLEQELIEIVCVSKPLDNHPLFSKFCNIPSAFFIKNVYS